MFPSKDPRECMLLKACQGLEEPLGKDPYHPPLSPAWYLAKGPHFWHDPLRQKESHPAPIKLACRNTYVHIFDTGEI